MVLNIPKEAIHSYAGSLALSGGQRRAIDGVASQKSPT